MCRQTALCHVIALRRLRKDAEDNCVAYLL